MDKYEWVDLSGPPPWGECEYSLHTPTKMECANSVIPVITAPDFGCNQHEPKERKWQQVRAPNWDEDTVTIDLDKMFGQWGRST